MRTKWIFVSPKFPKALAVRACGRETLFNSYLLHVFFGIFKNSSAPNYLEFRKFLAIILKGTVNTFHKKKNQRCPKSTHKLPLSPFSKYHKNEQFHHFHPFFFFETMHGWSNDWNKYFWMINVFGWLVWAIFHMEIAISHIDIL